MELIFAVTTIRSELIRLLCVESLMALEQTSVKLHELRPEALSPWHFRRLLLDNFSPREAMKILRFSTWFSSFFRQEEIEGSLYNFTRLRGVVFALQINNWYSAIGKHPRRQTLFVQKQRKRKNRKDLQSRASQVMESLFGQIYLSYYEIHNRGLFYQMQQPWFCLGPTFDVLLEQCETRQNVIVNKVYELYRTAQQLARAPSQQCIIRTWKDYLTRPEISNEKTVRDLALYFLATWGGQQALVRFYYQEVLSLFPYKSSPNLRALVHWHIRELMPSNEELLEGVDVFSRHGPSFQAFHFFPPVYHTRDFHFTMMKLLTKRFKRPSRTSYLPKISVPTSIMARQKFVDCRATGFELLYGSLPKNPAEFWKNLFQELRSHPGAKF